jgi:DNA-binding beta-propeller fold protein YncE
MALRNRASQAAAIGRQTAAVCAALLVASCTPSSRPGGALHTERVLGESGSQPGQYSYPRAIDTDGEALWVIDKLARIQRIDPASGDATVWWRMPEFAAGKPTGICLAPFLSADGIRDAVWVPDTHYHRVIVYPAPPAEARGEIDPAPLAQFGSYGVGPREFIYPTDVAVLLTESGDAVERVFVSEYGGNDRITVLDDGLEFLFAFGELGEGIDPTRTEFQRPQSIAIDPLRRELLIADSCNHRVGRFTPDGDLIGWIGSPDRSAGLDASF